MQYHEPMSVAAKRQVETLATALNTHLGVGVSMLCDRLVGDSSFMKRLHRKSMTLRKYDEFMAGASALWPDEKAPWPSGIPRMAPHLEQRKPRGQRKSSAA